MKAKITTRLLNVRSQPNAQAAIVGRLPEFAVVKVLEKKDDYLKIEYNNKEAFISAKFAKIYKEIPHLYECKILPRLLNVRSMANPTAPVLGQVAQNTIMNVMQESGKYLKVEYKDGFGYISAEYTTKVNSTEKPNSNTLHIKASPEEDTKTIKEVEGNAVVNVLDRFGSFLKIEYNDQVGYVSEKEIQENIDNKEEDILKDDEEDKNRKGKINVPLLNVRAEPTSGGQIVGQLKRNTLVEILEEKDTWYKIMYNTTIAYVASKYVNLVKEEAVAEKPSATTEEKQRGKITANQLNVRESASPTAKVLGRLAAGTIVEIVEKDNTWAKIKFGSKEAFVSAKFIRVLQGDEGLFFYQRKKFQTLALEPENQLKVPAAGQRKISYEIWNKYGNLLKSLSNEIGIEPASALAVLCVESGGAGFWKEGKCLIRFENHLFYSQWGRRNPGTFNKHFRFSYGAKWRGHYFREKSTDNWKGFHGNQAKEWDVLEFARKLDDTAALNSISMGAPQILGLNCKNIGYDNVQDMFVNFNKDIRYHIISLFDFFSPAMIRHLKNRNFVGFARYYNGGGQANTYGKWIKAYYDSFPKNV